MEAATAPYMVPRAAGIRTGENLSDEKKINEKGGWTRQKNGRHRLSVSAIIRP
jgi:hypothetical protein